MGLWSKAKGLFGRIKDKVVKPISGFISKFAAPIGTALDAVVPGAGAIGSKVGDIAAKVNGFVK